MPGIVNMTDRLPLCNIRLWGWGWFAYLTFLPFCMNNEFKSRKVVYLPVEHQNKQVEQGNRRGKPKDVKIGRNYRSNWLPLTGKPRCRGTCVSADYQTPKMIERASFELLLELLRHEQGPSLLCVYGEALGALAGAKVVTAKVREWKGSKGGLGFNNPLQVHVPNDKDVPQGHTLRFSPLPNGTSLGTKPLVPSSVSLQSCAASLQRGCAKGISCALFSQVTSVGTCCPWSSAQPSLCTERRTHWSHVFMLTSFTSM